MSAFARIAHCCKRNEGHTVKTICFQWTNQKKIIKKKKQQSIAIRKFYRAIVCEFLFNFLLEKNLWKHVERNRLNLTMRPFVYCYLGIFAVFGTSRIWRDEPIDASCGSTHSTILATWNRTRFTYYINQSERELANKKNYESQRSNTTITVRVLCERVCVCLCVADSRINSISYCIGCYG